MLLLLRYKKFKKRLAKNLANNISVTIAGVSFFGSLFFLSSNFTGFVISNSKTSNPTFIGGIFFLIAIVAFLFYIRNRN